MDKHEPKMRLADDGTLDVVIVCLTCRKEFRYGWDVQDTETSLREYRDFQAWAIDDATVQHHFEQTY